MKNIKNYFTNVLFLILLFGIVYLNAFISYRFGYVGDKNYWVVLLTFICLNINMTEKNKNVISNRGEKNEHMDC